MMPPRRTSPPAPRGVLVIAFLLLFVDGYDMFTLGTVGPALLADAAWGATPATLGTLAAATGLGMPIGSMAAGWLSDRAGRRLPVVAAIALISAAMLLASVAPNVVVLGAARFLTGIAIGALTPLIAAMVSDHAPARSRTLYIAIAFAAFGVGGSTSALLGAALLPETHFQWMFAPGVVPLLLLLPLWRVLPRPEQTDLPAGAGTPRQAVARPRELFSAQLRRSTVLLWAAAFLSLALIYSTVSWLPRCQSVGR